ncbi:MAG: hypothetical protein CMJ62_07930 [Planctomycetaceae bacterium]|nr:hypothetical protein [Planctomycetaceae bacterium]
MDKDTAEQALAIIRDVIQNTRDDLVAHNWGVIWMIHAFVNFAGAAAGTMIDRQELPVPWYLIPLSVVALIDILLVLFLTERDRGVRSFVEWQLWGIWVVFIVFILAGTAVLQLSGASSLLFCPLFAMTSGLSVAMMGIVFYRRFLIYAAMFVVVMVFATMVPSVQWWLVGVAWWCTMFIPGLSMYRERKGRQQESDDARIL